MKFDESISKISTRGIEVVEISKGLNPNILRVCDDSRKVQPGDLFVARGGTKTDGANYIAEALARGVVGIVTGEGAAPAADAVATARVTNVNLACALLAHEVAGNPTAGMKLIGVTGT